MAGAKRQSNINGLVQSAAGGKRAVNGAGVGSAGNSTLPTKVGVGGRRPDMAATAAAVSL